MRFAFFLFFLIIFSLACKQDKAIPLTEEEKFMIKIAGEDYKEDIRLPVQANGHVDTNLMARIQFLTKELDFDTVIAGSTLDLEFTFKNNGVKQLDILDVRTTCGCTVSEYEQEPVAPGKTGNIKIKMDTEALNGLQEKIIRVYSNTYPNESLLKIKGFVNSHSENKDND